MPLCFYLTTNSVTVFLKVIFALSSPCHICGCLLADGRCHAQVYGETYVAELNEYVFNGQWSPHEAVTDAFCLNSYVVVDCLSGIWMNIVVGSMGEMGNTESQRSENLLINLYTSTNIDL